MDEAKESLRSIGIDMRDKSIDIQDARDAVWKKLEHERKTKLIVERARILANDPVIQSDYFDKTRQILTAMEDQQFKDWVSKGINDRFERKFFERLNNIFEKCQTVRGLEKRRFFIKLKHFLMRSRAFE